MSKDRNGMFAFAALAVVAAFGQIDTPLARQVTQSGDDVVLATSVPFTGAANGDQLDVDGKELVLALEAPALVPACWSCTACQQGNSHVMHILFNPETDIFGIGHECAYGTDHDCEDHDLCLLPEEDELGKLWRALETFDGEQLRSVVAAYAHVVVFNAERSALQIIACDGVIGHIPLSGTRLRVFSGNQGATSGRSS